jgi:hypothetical protein
VYGGDESEGWRKAVERRISIEDETSP